MIDLHTNKSPNKRNTKKRNGNGHIRTPRNFSELFAAFDRLYISKKHKTEASRKMHRIRAGQFCDWCEVEGIKLKKLNWLDVENYLGSLTNRRGEPLETNTVNGHARLIKTILNWAWRKGFIPKKINFDMPDVVAVQIKYLNDQQQNALMTHPDIHPRDRALVKFLIDTGARLAEALSLNWGDLTYDETTGDGTAFVIGKFNKPRTTFYTSEAWKLLIEWANEFKGGYKSPDEPLFFPYTDQHFKPGARLTTRGADHIFRRISETVGFKVRAHMLRHTSVANNKKRGASDDLLMWYYGWSSPEMPRRYGKIFPHDQRLIWRNFNGTAPARNGNLTTNPPIDPKVSSAWLCEHNKAASALSLTPSGWGYIHLNYHLLSLCHVQIFE